MTTFKYFSKIVSAHSEPVLNSAINTVVPIQVHALLL